MQDIFISRIYIDTGYRQIQGIDRYRIQIDTGYRQIPWIQYIKYMIQNTPTVYMKQDTEIQDIGQRIHGSYRRCRIQDTGCMEYKGSGYRIRDAEIILGLKKKTVLAMGGIFFVLHTWYIYYRTQNLFYITNNYNSNYMFKFTTIFNFIKCTCSLL